MDPCGHVNTPRSALNTCFFHYQFRTHFDTYEVADSTTLLSQRIGEPLSVSNFNNYENRARSFIQEFFGYAHGEEGEGKCFANAAGYNRQARGQYAPCLPGVFLNMIHTVC